jgi:hypothetical protein
MKRRAFLAAFAGTGFATTLLPGVLWAQMQQGTKVVTAEMVREAARLAGLDLTDAEAQDLTSSLSSLARGAEGIDRRTLTNASPLPIHFDPRPHGVAIAPPPRGSMFRIEAPPAAKRPARELTQRSTLCRVQGYFFLNWYTRPTLNRLSAQLSPSSLMNTWSNPARTNIGSRTRTSIPRPICIPR